MSTLLFIFERDMPTVSIMREMFTHLRSHDDMSSTFMYMSDVKPKDIDAHDVIIFIRPNNTYAWKLADNAKKAGHTVVTLCDDDLLNLPKTSPTIPWRKRGLLKALKHSDVILSTSRYIAERYRDLTAGKRMALMDTVVRPEEFDGIETVFNNGDDDGKVKIVYAAAPSHAVLFEKFIGPILPALKSEFGDRISFTFVSVHPEVTDFRCEYVPGMPLLEYREYMKKSRFDIGVAPLYDDDFSKCKYYNKYIEYTLQGTVGIYSETEPYTYVVKNGYNGFLAKSSPEAWLEAMRQAIRDKEKRDLCLKRAVDHLRESHSEDAVIEKIRQGLPEISAAGTGYGSCKGFGLRKVLYMLSRPFDWIYLTGFYIKNTGIKAVIKRIKKHFIEAEAYRRR